MLSRPKSEEFLPHFQVYVNLVPEGNLLELLKEQSSQIVDQLASVTGEQGAYRYAEGKWSLKEVIGHMADTERIMSYRLLRIARGDTTPLPGFEEQLFVSNAGFDRFTLGELLEDFQNVRKATLSLIRGLDETAWQRMGHYGGGEGSARSLGYIIAGHAIHHLNIINERYLA